MNGIDTGYDDHGLKPVRHHQGFSRLVKRIFRTLQPISAAVALPLRAQELARTISNASAAQFSQLGGRVRVISEM